MLYHALFRYLRLCLPKLSYRGFNYWENSFKHKLTTMTSKAGPTKAQITPSASDSQQLQRKKSIVGFSVQTMCLNAISNKCRTQNLYILSWEVPCQRGSYKYMIKEVLLTWGWTRAVSGGLVRLGCTFFVINGLFLIIILRVCFSSLFCVSDSAHFVKYLPKIDI